jgi:processive 1,2-diacylglycerol beta-glucosyltransferase
VAKELKSYRLSNVLVLGFYDQMPKLYTIADIFISKPGGLSTAEALYYRLPILVTHWLPGQEELNIHYLLSKGLIMSSIQRQMNPATIIRATVEEVRSQNFRKMLSANPNLAEVIDQEEAGKRVKFAIQQVTDEQFDKS